MTRLNFAGTAATRGGAVEPARSARWWQRVAGRIGALAGWRVEVSGPLPERCVMVGAHHTSGADWLAGMLLLAVTGTAFRWAAKDSLFWGPLGFFARGLGGVPVNRRQRTNFVARMAAAFRDAPQFRLGILPEGTRRRTDHWKTGFYRIALAAGVPIVLGFADYSRRVVGWGPTLVPTGDIEADFEVMRQFYAGVQPRHPEKKSEMRLRPHTG